jgi:hypothetical protein
MSCREARGDERVASGEGRAGEPAPSTGVFCMRRIICHTHTYGVCRTCVCPGLSAECCCVPAPVRVAWSRPVRQVQVVVTRPRRFITPLSLRDVPLLLPHPQSATALFTTPAAYAQINTRTHDTIPTPNCGPERRKRLHALPPHMRRMCARMHNVCRERNINRLLPRHLPPACGRGLTVAPLLASQTAKSMRREGGRMGAQHNKFRAPFAIRRERG